MSSGPGAIPDTGDGFVALLRAAARDTPDRLFARFEAEPFTVSAIDAMSRALAGWLAGAGVGRGDRVALMLGNAPVSLALLFALARMGAVWVPVNVQSRGDNLAYILGHARPALIVCADALATLVGSAAGHTPVRRASDATAALGAPVPAAEDASVGADDPFAIMYTSGTTGPPKGVIVSHRMLRFSGEAAALVSSARAGDVMFMWEPLFHIGGAQMIVLPLIRDVTLAMVERFSASRFWHQVRAAGATHIHFLGGILQMLLKQPHSPLDRGHGVRVAWGGGCPREIWTDFEDRFGVEIRECYGMTECSSVTTLNDRRVVGSVGTAVPWFDVTLLDPSGHPVPSGARGEIVVRATVPGALTRGYLDNPSATARALRDGAFYTGDIGSFDAGGNLYFHGRMSDSVRVNGQNVSAFEVEHVAAKHPDVADCAMIGVAAEVGEQDIKLFVKLRPGAGLTSPELSAWLSTRLAPFQLPRYIVLVPEFERTPSQRIMKHRLASAPGEVWDRRAAQPG